MMPAKRDEPQCKHKIDNAIYRAKRHGLNDGQMAIWYGLARWFEENPDAPSHRQLADISGVSLSLINWYLPVLEALEIITTSKNRNGIRIRGSMRLWKYPPGFLADEIGA